MKPVLRDWGAWAVRCPSVPVLIRWQWVGQTYNHDRLFDAHRIIQKALP